MSDFLQTLTNLTARGLLQNQLAPGDPQILVLVLSQDRQAVLDCKLKPFSEVAALFGSHDHPTNP